MIAMSKIDDGDRGEGLVVSYIKVDGGDGCVGSKRLADEPSAFVADLVLLRTSTQTTWLKVVAMGE